MFAHPEYAVFSADRLLTRGPLLEALESAWTAMRENHDVIIIDLGRGRPVDFDLRGDLEAVLARHQPAPVKRGPGRPKLGVVAREVTLLPRHWDWLNAQPGGASVALRRLVDEARKAPDDQTSKRQAQNAIYGFISAMGGDRPGFEEASRALFASDRTAFSRHIATWPPHVRETAESLAAFAFGPEQTP